MASKMIKEIRIFSFGLIKTDSPNRQPENFNLSTNINWKF